MVLVMMAYLMLVALASSRVLTVERLRQIEDTHFTWEFYAGGSLLMMMMIMMIMIIFMMMWSVCSGIHTMLLNMLSEPVDDDDDDTESDVQYFDCESSVIGEAETNVATRNLLKDSLCCVDQAAQQRLCESDSR